MYSCAVQSLVNRAKSMSLDCTCTTTCPASKPPQAWVYRGKLSVDKHSTYCTGKKCSARVANLVSNAKNVASRAGVCFGYSALRKGAGRRK